MKKKKLNSNSKEENITYKKNTKRKPVAVKKDQDFGGIPDVDPKKFLGCG